MYEDERGTGQVDIGPRTWLGAGKVTVKIENTYSDGYESTTTVDVDGPDDGVDIDCWWADVVYPHTGDGHGVDSDLGSCLTATIIAAEHPGLVGKTAEWTD